MTHYRLFTSGVIFQSFADRPFDVRRKGFMSIHVPRRSLLVALLGLGLAGGVCAAESVPQQHGPGASDVITSQAAGVGETLVPSALPDGLVASTERDVGRVATQFDTLHRHRPCLLRTASVIRRLLCTCDDAGRLLRAGIHSSTLGTPPPLS